MSRERKIQEIDFNNSVFLRMNGTSIHRCLFEKTQQFLTPQQLAKGSVETGGELSGQNLAMAVMSFKIKDKANIVHTKHVIFKHEGEDETLRLKNFIADGTFGLDGFKAQLEGFFGKENVVRGVGANFSRAHLHSEQVLMISGFSEHLEGIEKEVLVGLEEPVIENIALDLYTTRRPCGKCITAIDKTAVKIRDRFDITPLVRISSTFKHESKDPEGLSDIPLYHVDINRLVLTDVTSTPGRPKIEDVFGSPSARPAASGSGNKKGIGGSAGRTPAVKRALLRSNSAVSDESRDTEAPPAKTRVRRG